MPFQGRTYYLPSSRECNEQPPAVSPFKFTTAARKCSPETPFKGFLSSVDSSRTEQRGSKSAAFLLAQMRKQLPSRDWACFLKSGHKCLGYDCGL